MNKSKTPKKKKKLFQLPIKNPSLQLLNSSLTICKKSKLSTVEIKPRLKPDIYNKIITFQDSKSQL